jgi:hypothetical protein
MGHGIVSFKKLNDNINSLSLFVPLGPLMLLRTGHFLESFLKLISLVNIFLHIFREKMGFRIRISMGIRIRRSSAIPPHLFGWPTLSIFLKPVQFGS